MVVFACAGLPALAPAYVQRRLSTALPMYGACLCTAARYVRRLPSVQRLPVYSAPYVALPMYSAPYVQRYLHACPGWLVSNERQRQLGSFCRMRVAAPTSPRGRFAVLI